MTVLSRYIVKHNLFLLCVLFLTAIGIYLLADIFERMDTFLASDVSFLTSVLYFLIKLPNIISQLLPAVFLLALVIQLNILKRTNESVALLAGGISPIEFIKFILLYGLMWSCIQLTFSQYLGVHGDAYARSIWAEQVKGRTAEREIQGLWFSEKNMVVHLDSVDAIKGTGTGFLAYTLSDDRLSFSSIIKAKSFSVHKKYWELFDGGIAIPASYSREPFSSYTLSMDQDLKVFGTVELLREPKLLPLWELGDVIIQLQKAGSNVERYKVAWHSKIAYAMSTLTMGFLAIAISQLTGNIYKAVAISLLCIFVFFFLDKAITGFGERGALNPVVAAWFTNITYSVVSLGAIIWPTIKQKKLF